METSSGTSLKSYEEITDIFNREFPEFEHNDKSGSDKTVFEYLFHLADFEFGEIYHVGAAKCLSKLFQLGHIIEVNVSRCSKKQVAFLQQMFERKEIHMNSTVRLSYLNQEAHKKENYASGIFKPILGETATIITTAIGMNKPSKQPKKKQVQPKTPNQKENTEKAVKYLKEQFTKNLSQETAKMVQDFLDQKLQQGKLDSSVIVHIRNGSKYKERNMNPSIFKDIVKRASDNSISSFILIGDATPMDICSETTALVKFQFIFINGADSIQTHLDKRTDNIAGQIAFFHELAKRANVKCAYGVKSGGFDVLGFTGIQMKFYTLNQTEEDFRIRIICEALHPYFELIECQSQLIPL